MSELQKDPNENVELQKIVEAEAPKKFETEGSTIFAKHEYNTKKPAEKAGLKRILTCVIAVVLCFAIGGSILLVNKLLPDDEGGVNSIENRSISILQKSNLLKDSFVKIDGKNALVDSNVASVTIKNAYDEYTIIPQYSKPQKSDSSSSSASSSTSKEYDYTTSYKLEYVDSSLTLPKVISNHVNDVLSLVAMQEMSNTFDSVKEYHAYYGLDKPTRVCTIKFNDGTEEIKISVGKQVSTGSADYVTVSGSDTVYIVSSDYIEHYDRIPTYFANPEVIPIIEQTEDNADYFTTNGDLLRFDYIKISGSIVGQEITFKMNTGASSDHIPYRMKVPYDRPASNVFIGKILDFARDGVKAENVYTYEAIPASTLLCGIDKPKYVIELKAGDYHFKLIIGGIFEEGSDNIAAMVEGKPQIFSLMPSHVEFLTGDLNAMFSPDFILDSISEIKTITYKDSTGTHSFNLTHKKREDSENAYDSEVTYKGAKMDIKSFKLLYQRALMLSLMSFVTEAEEKSPVLTIELTYNSGEKKKFAFTEIDDDQFHYTAWCEGQPYGEVLASSVKDVMSSLATYLAGGEVKDIY